MGKTITEKELEEKRRAGRERKAKQRAAARAKGVPESSMIYKAIVEANGYAMVMVLKGLWDVEEAWGPINSFLIIEVATDILVDRGGFDKKITKRAIVDALKTRPNWSDSSFSPTTDWDTASKRYRLRPPAWVTSRPQKPSTPPLPHQDGSQSSHY